MSYRCQGCRDYFRGEPHRRLRLGAVCSPECLVIARDRQRGGFDRDMQKPGARAGVNPRHTQESASGSDDNESVEDDEPASGSTDDQSGSPPASGSADDKTRIDQARIEESASGPTDDIHQVRSDDEDRDAPHQADGPSKRTRAKVIARDCRCRFCGNVQDRHLHHIKYRSEGHDHSEFNLIWLCEKHHRLVHTDKGLWQPILMAYIEHCYAGRKLFILEVKRLLESSSVKLS